MIDRLEFIHSKYIVHRDIKPDNFLVGNPDTSLIYLIDFGLAKKYMSGRTGKHVKFIINKNWSGTSRFASANSLRGVVQSRRDDLESLCYILLYFMKGNLPWDNVFGCSENEDNFLIYKIKKHMKPELLFLNLPQETIDFFKYCKKLDFEQKPDYNYLRSLLLKILNYKNEKNDLNFSWVNKTRNHLINNKVELLNNKHRKNSKKKSSPQQRIYNSLLKNKINVVKRCESVNEFYIEKNVNKVKRDCQAIKNISPSPKPISDLNNLLIRNRKEKEKEKLKKNIKKNPNIKKILLDNVIKNNINSKIQILKSQNEFEKEEKNNKSLNIILLQNFQKKFLNKNKFNIYNSSFENEKYKIYLNDSQFNNKNNNNNKIIKKNNSYNDIGKGGTFPIRFNSTKNDYRRLFDNNNNIINNDNKINDVKNYYHKKIYNYNNLDNYSYNYKGNNKMHLVLKNSFLNNIKDNSGPKIFKANNHKISSKNSSLNTNNINNKIVSKKVKSNTKLAKKVYKNKIKVNEDKRKNNLYALNRKNYMKYNTNQTRLITDRNNNSSFININNNTNYINAKNINFKPNGNIKIINIIYPTINKTTTNSKNSFSSNLSNYKDNNQYNNNKSINSKNEYENKLLSQYYSNISLFDNYQHERLFLSNNTSSSNINSYETSFNEEKNIIKTNSYFNHMNLKYNKRNNFSNFKLKIDLNKNSLRYNSPQIIEKYKTDY